MNDTIHTPKSNKAQGKVDFKFREKDYSANYFIANDTTHFSVNGPVSSHAYGNWDNTKHAILVSLEDVCKKN